MAESIKISNISLKFSLLLDIILLFVLTNLLIFYGEKYYFCLSKVAVRYKKKLIKRYVSRAATSKAYLFMFMEVWKDIIDYEGIYPVSDLGRVKSLGRYARHWRGGLQIINERILINQLGNNGYYKIVLCKDGIQKSISIHQLMAESFLNHKICGHKLVVNHIDLDRSNNKLENLEIVTTRENNNKKHLKSSSKYTGVGWKKSINKWYSSISINGKNKFLGYFKDEYDAHIAYEKALCEIKKASN